MAVYTYSVATDTATGAVSLAALDGEIVAAGLFTPTFQGVSLVGDVLTVMFDGALQATEEATVSGVIAAHTGSPPIVTRFVESSEFIELDKVINQTTSWEELGGVVTNAQALLVTSGLSGDLSRAVGRVILQVKSTGTGGELKIVEVDDAGNQTDLCSVPTAIPDTSGSWQTLRVTTDMTPAAGDRTYVLMGRRNSAPVVNLRYASITLLDVGP